MSHRGNIDELTKASAYMNAKRAALRDIAIDDVRPRKYAERNRCEFSFTRFCHEFLSTESFFQDGNFYHDQIDRMARLEHAILNGDDIAIAAFRGSAKTTEARAAVIWAILYGHASHAVLIGATSADAQANLEAIKSELQTNEKLSEHFPDSCVPIRALGNSSRRAGTQTVGGQHTFIRWETTRIVMPKLPERASKLYKCHNSIIQVRSMDGSLRGLNYLGKRPDLILLDDVETRESVKSQGKTAEIRRKYDTDIAGSEGHKKSATKIWICTIQDEDCVSAEFTDPSRRPALHGIRQRYLIHWPNAWKDGDSSSLWGKYMDIRRDAVFGGPDKARAFYVENRGAMDAGAVVSWEEGYDNRKYESALEKFFAMWADKKEEGLAFIACEYQNNPEMMTQDDGERLTESGICERVSGLKPMQIPVEAEQVVGMVDVHGTSGRLYYSVLAVGHGFKHPVVVDFGTWPKRGTIGDKYPGLSVEAAITSALSDLATEFGNRDWHRDDGLEMIPRFGADSGSSWADTIYEFCRTRPNWVPTKGDNPKFKAFNPPKPRPGVLYGNNWRSMTAKVGMYKTRGFIFNANYWKRFTVNRLAVQRHEETALSFSVPRMEAILPMARHIMAETPRTVIEKGTGNEYEEWMVRPGAENHWFDTIVGAFVMASVSGIQMTGGRKPKARTKARKRISFNPV